MSGNDLYVQIHYKMKDGPIWCIVRCIVTLGQIFSNGGFLILTIGGYLAMVPNVHLDFGSITDISTALCLQLKKKTCVYFW